jgi:radical SAM superfamily enzyme YgiQ (UPF0313 family)
MKYRLIALNCRYSHSCLALFYLRQALGKHLPDAWLEMLALTINDPYYQSLQRILAGDPDVLFFSAYIWNGERIARLVTDIAQVKPGLPMIIGGPQANFLGPLPEGCCIVSGEIEGLPDSFYTDLARISPSRRGGTSSGMNADALGEERAGLAYNKELASRYTGESGHAFPSPYQRDDFATHLKNRQILYESSRGCPFSCAYCLSAASRGVRHKPLSLVEAEIRQIMEARPPLVKFVDRTFNDNPERALTIWRMLARIGGSTRFHFEIAPDRFTEEQLSFLETVSVGLFQFEIGIQSTDPHTLAAINRRMDVGKALATISRLRAMENVHLHVDLILGLPEDTETSFARSFRDVFATRPHHIQMGLLKVLPATPLSGQVAGHSIIYCQKPPYEVLATAAMSASVLARLHLFGECVERFCNNRYFPSLWEYLRNKDKDIFAFFSELLTVCLKGDLFSHAPTQQRLVELLSDLCGERPDWQLIRELLVFDWLRCGHRFLPDCLAGEDLARIRTRMRRSMPNELNGVYSARGRNSFFKHTIFYPFSSSACAVLGLESCSWGAVVCFLEKTEEDLYAFRAIVSLPMKSEYFS